MATVPPGDPVICFDFFMWLGIGEEQRECYAGIPGGGTATAREGVPGVASGTFSMFDESTGPDVPISSPTVLVETEAGMPPGDSGAVSAMIRMNVPGRLGVSGEAASIAVATEGVRVGS